MATSLIAYPVETFDIQLSALAGKMEAFFEARADAEEAARELIMRAFSLTAITTDEQRAEATGFMREAAAGVKLGEKVCAEGKQAANKLHKSFTGAENALAAEFLSVRNRLEPMALRYDREQESKRQAMMARLAEESRREAEEAQIAQAERLQAQGDAEAAEAALSRETAPSPVFIAQRASVAGESKAVRWTAEVTDLATLVKAVAEGKAPLCAIQADVSFLKREANNRKQHFSMPGVSARPEESLRIRA